MMLRSLLLVRLQVLVVLRSLLRLHEYPPGLCCSLVLPTQFLQQFRPERSAQVGSIGDQTTTEVMIVYAVCPTVPARTERTCGNTTRTCTTICSHV